MMLIRALPTPYAAGVVRMLSAAVNHSSRQRKVLPGWNSARRIEYDVAAPVRVQRIAAGVAHWIR